MITAEQYEKMEKLVSGPRPEGVSDEFWNGVIQQVQEYRDTYTQATNTAAGWQGPGTGAPQAQAPAGPDPGQLDPNLPLLPQALATQPGSTHPQGDEAAAAEYMRSGGASAKGSVMVYEPPLAIVKKRILDNPGLLRSLGYDEIQPAPEDIVAMDASSEFYQAVADDMWRKAADEAAKAGKTAYRYSKMPAFQNAGAGGVLNSLALTVGGGVKPALEGVNAFVMGVDDTAAFGALRGAEEAVNGELATPSAGETVGGIQPAPAEQYHAQTIEQHPVAYGVGQGIGALIPWSASNRLYEFVATGGKGARAAMAASKGRTLLNRTLDAGSRGALGGAATGAVQEGVDVASEAYRTGEGPTEDRLAEAGERVKAAGRESGIFGVGGEVAGRALGSANDWFRHGPRYDGVPGRLERAGVEFSPTKGPQSPPGVQRAVEKGRELDVKPGDVIASEIAPAIKGAADERVKGTIERITERKRSYFKTREGQQLLPVTNLIDRSVQILRRKHQPGPGGVEPIDLRAHEQVKRTLNSQAASVSTKPVEGAIPLSPEEADEFLSESVKAPLRSKKKAPAAGGGGARELDPDDLAARSAVKHGGERMRKKLREPPFPMSQGYKEFTEQLEFLLDAPRIDGDVLREVDQLATNFKLRDNEYNHVQDALYPPEPRRARKDPIREAVAGRGPVADGPTPLATDLRRRGVETVYVVPRRYDAERHQELLNDLRGSRQEQQTYRELQELDEAARMDRDARTLDGKPGGWSALQEEHEKWLAEEKGLEKIVAPGGESYRVLAGHGDQKTGEMLSVQALRKAADTAGVREQLEQIRMLDPLQQLQKESNFAHFRTSKGTERGVVNSAVDFLAPRIFGVTRRLEGPSGPIRGGTGGKAGLVGRDESEKKRDKKRAEERAK